MFDDAKLKIKRAKKHINQLQSEIVAFGQRQPDTPILKVDEQARKVEVGIRILENPHACWGAIAGDAVHNLRSALDILWRVVWPVSIADENRRDGFPIYDDPEKFKTRFGRIKEGPRYPVVVILRALQPYQSGNKLLWWLESISNADKHRMLIPIIANCSGTFTFTPQGLPPFLVTMELFDLTYPLEGDTYLFHVECPPMHVEVKAELSIPIAFGEPQIVHREDMIATLHQLTGEVEGVAEAFGRAGLLPGWTPTPGSGPSQAAPASGSHPPTT